MLCNPKKVKVSTILSHYRHNGSILLDHMCFNLFKVHLYLRKRTLWSCNRILLPQFYQQYVNQSVSYYLKFYAYCMLPEYTDRFLQRMILNLRALFFAIKQANQ